MPPTFTSDELETIAKLAWDLGQDALYASDESTDLTRRQIEAQGLQELAALPFFSAHASVPLVRCVFGQNYVRGYRHAEAYSWTYEEEVWPDKVEKMGWIDLEDWEEPTA